MDFLKMKIVLVSFRIVSSYSIRCLLFWILQTLSYERSSVYGWYSM